MSDDKLRLLLVEDDTEDLEIFERMLSKIDGLEYDLEWRSSYAGAQETILNEEFDVIFMDYRLGDGTGIDLLRYAKENNSRAPIIFLSAESSRDIYKEIKRWGALNYLKKGEITPNHLAIAIDYAIEIAAQYEFLRDIATHDGLTDLYNHREMHILLEKEIFRARRYSTPLSLVMFDIDKFKDANDKYGHLVGDQVLKWLADIVRDTSRRCDINARYGGEEFAIIMPETERARAAQKAEILRSKVEAQPCVGRGFSVGLTISIGVAELGDDDTKEMLINKADRLLYKAKAQGRNYVCY